MYFDVYLYQVECVVMGECLDVLCEVFIWVESVDFQGFLGGMCYYLDVGWLELYGYDFCCVFGVEISDFEEFFWVIWIQFWVVMYELVYVYYYWVLGFDEFWIMVFYWEVVECGNYEEIFCLRGCLSCYYGFMNYKEYFVEGMEVYFGMNDYYFFVCGEFECYDLKFYVFLCEIWEGQCVIRMDCCVCGLNIIRVVGDLYVRMRVL